MALTGTLEVPPELLELFNKIISPSNTRTTGAVRKHGYLQSRQKIANLTTRSLLPEIRDLKLTLTPAEIIQWKAAAKAQNSNWWNLFVQDTAYRIKYGINGLAVPSVIHQYKVGRIEIAAPAERVVLTQYHPNKYYINKKKRGNTTIREDVPVYEILQLPLTIGLSYRSQLLPTRSNYRVRMYATVFSSYQGRTIETEHELPLELSSDWQQKTTQISEVLGAVRYYQLFIELDGVQGWLEFDNTKAIHTGTNWARDYRCNDVNNELTRTNFQIEKSWEEIFLPYKAAFGSVYPED